MPQMPDVPAAELFILAARFGFVLLLYLLVIVVLVALGRRLLSTPSDSGAASVGPAATLEADSAFFLKSAAPQAEAELEGLTLVEAAPEDAPAGRVVPLDRPVVIGRRPECDIVLHDSAVSGRHARISGHNGTTLVEDLGSTNGTFVNGRRITQAAPLHLGDTVRTGGAVWRLDPFSEHEARV